MTWHKRFSGFGPKIALLLVAAIGGLALAEIIVRLLGIGPTFQVVYREILQLSDNPILRYELRAGAGDGVDPINSAGFRDREYAMAKTDGLFRIIAIGDSVTYGIPAPGASDKSWPKQLERLLNARSTPAAPRFEVLNLGVIGYNITQVAERLRVLGMDYEPNLVIYGYVLNDPQSFSVEAQALLERRDAAERQFHEQFGQGLARALGWSRLFLIARHATMNEGKRPAFRREKPLVDPGYDAVRAGDARGEYFLALHRNAEPTQRLIDGLDALRKNAGDVPVVIAIFPLFLDSSQRSYGLTEAHQRVADASRARGFQVIDLQRAFAKLCAANVERSCAEDFMHPDAFGFRVAAAAMLRDIAGVGLLPEGSVNTMPGATGDLIDTEIDAALAAIP
jgi:hypothetical protein